MFRVHFTSPTMLRLETALASRTLRAMLLFRAVNVRWYGIDFASQNRIDYVLERDPHVDQCVVAHNIGGHEEMLFGVPLIRRPDVEHSLYDGLLGLRVDRAHPQGYEWPTHSVPTHVCRPESS